MRCRPNRITASSPPLPPSLPCPRSCYRAYQSAPLRRALRRVARGPRIAHGKRARAASGRIVPRCWWSKPAVFRARGLACSTWKTRADDFRAAAPPVTTFGRLQQSALPHGFGCPKADSRRPERRNRPRPGTREGVARTGLFPCPEGKKRTTRLVHPEPDAPWAAAWTRAGLPALYRVEPPGQVVAEGLVMHRCHAQQRPRAARPAWRPPRRG